MHISTRQLPTSEQTLTWPSSVSSIQAASQIILPAARDGLLSRWVLPDGQPGSGQPRRRGDCHGRVPGLLRLARQ